MKDLFGFLFLLSPVILVVGWLGLTWLLWKGGHRLLGSEFANRWVQVALVVTVAIVWVGSSFWYAGGRKIYYDAWVERMCAKDGGVRVYETVKLPAEKFDKYGVFTVPKQNTSGTDAEYFYESVISYYRKGNPEVWRLHFEVFRHMDKKLLGEAVRYGRRGGDLIGPWHESSFGCPDNSDISDLKKQLFTVTR